MRILVTGTSGFIGYFVAERLLAGGHTVQGIDDLNPYYPTALKQARLDRLQERQGFTFERLAVNDREGMRALFAGERFDRVIHLAAQAGVRYSIENPEAYIDSNVSGFLTILEGCRAQQTPHLVYASTSSVYGANTRQPFSEHHGADRPDMAAYLFTKAILAGEPIKVFNAGQMRRDFTYVEDVAEAVVRVMDAIPAPDPAWNSDDPDPATSRAPFRIFNVGNSQPVELNHFIAVLEELLGKSANREDLPLQPGDVLSTAADISDLEAAIGYAPKTSIEEGLAKFVAWYRAYAGN
jgi:UDP-glucuronate 4-epimerase